MHMITAILNCLSSAHPMTDADRPPHVAEEIAATTEVHVDTTSPRDESQHWPLVMVGPGAEYSRRYIACGPAGADIACIAGATTSRECGVATDPILTPLTSAWTAVSKRFHQLAAEIFSGGQPSPHLASEHHNEPDPQADARPEAGRPMAAHEGLLADHARTRRHAWRQQGHGVRTRRVAHLEGGAGEGSEQGSLFDAVA